MFGLYTNVLTHSTGVYRTQSNCTSHTRFLSWYFQSWTSLKYYTNLRLLSHKNVTFTLQVMKNQANILFPSKYHFPVSIFTADKSSDFWVQSVLIKTLMWKQAKKTWLYSSKFSRWLARLLSCGCTEIFEKHNIFYIPWGCNRKNLIIIILFIPCPRHS